MSRKILEMRAISRPRACPQYRGDNSCWRDLMTVSPAPLCCLSYFILNRTNYKFPAHFLEFSWYLKYIFVLYLNNRLKLSQSGQFLIIWRHREREQDKHYVKQIYISNCLYLTVFLALLLMLDYIYLYTTVCMIYRMGIIFSWDANCTGQRDVFGYSYCVRRSQSEMSKIKIS